MLHSGDLFPTLDLTHLNWEMRKLRNQSEIELNGTLGCGVTLWLSAKAFSRHKSVLTAVRKHCYAVWKVNQSAALLASTLKQRPVVSTVDLACC